MSTENTSPVETLAEPATEPASAPDAETVLNEEKTADFFSNLDPDKADIETLATTEVEDPIVNTEEPYKDIDYNTVLSALPENARKLVANLRADYTRKTQQLAEMRKQLEAQLTNSLSDDYYTKLQQLASQQPEYNPFDPASQEAVIEAKVAQRLQELVAPIRQQQQQLQLQQKYEAFVQEHPDFEEYKDEVETLLKENDRLLTPEAYHIVRSRKLAERANAQKEELERLRKQALDAGLKVSSGVARSVHEPPQGLSPIELYQWYSEHPEVKD